MYSCGRNSSAFALNLKAIPKKFKMNYVLYLKKYKECEFRMIYTISCLL